MGSLNKIHYAWFADFTIPWETFPRFYVPPPDLLISWTSDGISVMSILLQPDSLKIVMEADASLPPARIAQRLKGRMQNHLSKLDIGFPGFFRGFFFRSLGQNDRSTVASYIREQVNHSDLVDPLYRISLNKLRYHDRSLERIRTSHQSVYDLHLHLVLVVGGRFRMCSEQAKDVADSVVSAFSALQCPPVELSVMPDHLHALCAFPHSLSPLDVLEGVKQGSGGALRRSAFWAGGGYTGTVGPYRLAVALDRNAKAGGWHPGLTKG